MCLTDAVSGGSPMVISMVRKISMVTVLVIVTTMILHFEMGVKAGAGAPVIIPKSRFLLTGSKM
jgi:hypothetical protein